MLTLGAAGRADEQDSLWMKTEADHPGSDSVVARVQSHVSGFPPGQTASSSKRVLEPIERISEVLFGLIMVLTFTCTFSVAEAGRAEVGSLLLGALGCNIAWGIIDAIMYLMGVLAEKARALGTLRAVRRVGEPEKAHQLILQAVPSVVASGLSRSTLEDIRLHLEQLSEAPTHPRLTKRDWTGAGGVFALVTLATLPVVLPFALMENAMRAQRLSNLVAIGLLFLTGYSFGRCTGYHPRGMGLAMVALGGVLVGITILLGG
jgi:VIT1/CCC1 family predicted Fe2+/Mn2+ transporter